jgi:hypothetical protein
MGRRRRGTWRRFPASSLGPTNERSEAKRGVLEASWWLGGLSPASPCLRTEGRGAKVRHHLTESTAYKQDILYLLWPVRMVSRAPGGALYCNSQNECLVSREGGASRKRIGRMRLTTFTDYCLRVLMFVGAKEGETSTIEEIAGSYGISRNHLMKVVFRLGQLGYLTNVRGKGAASILPRNPSGSISGLLFGRPRRIWRSSNASDNPQPIVGSSRLASCARRSAKPSMPSWLCSTPIPWPIFWRPDASCRRS